MSCTVATDDGRACEPLRDAPRVLLGDGSFPKIGGLLGVGGAGVRSQRFVASAFISHLGEAWGILGNESSYLNVELEETQFKKELGDSVDNFILFPVFQ